MKKREKVMFPGATGELLTGHLMLPVDGQPAAFALFAHCFTCTKNLKAINHITEAMNLHGIAVLKFDFTGLGESEGEFADSNFSSNVGDLVAAARFLEEKYEGPKVLVGHSLGGAAVLQAACGIPTATAVATIGSPAEPAHVTRLFRDRKKEIDSEGEAVVTLAGRSFRIRKQFIEDLSAQRMEGAIRNLRKALLVLHSPVDEIVGIDNARKIFDAAIHPKSYISLDTADHLLMDEGDAIYAGAMIGAWAQKFLGQNLPPAEAAPEVENRVMARTPEGGFFTEIGIREHSLVADEPVSFGGTDRGPTPYDYLLAGLGACTTMTLRMYADRKKWPLESAVVRLTHRKIHTSDCEGCDGENRKIDAIERELSLFGPLEEKQRRRLVEIAERCPVHRTLHSEVRIDTLLASEPPDDGSKKNQS